MNGVRHYKCLIQKDRLVLFHVAAIGRIIR